MSGALRLRLRATWAYGCGRMVAYGATAVAGAAVPGAAVNPDLTLKHSTAQHPQGTRYPMAGTPTAVGTRPEVSRGGDSVPVASTGMGGYCLWSQFAQKWAPGVRAVPQAVQCGNVVGWVADWACMSLPQLMQKWVPAAFAVVQRGQLVVPIWGIGW